MLSAFAIRSSTGLCARLNGTFAARGSRPDPTVGSLLLAINVEHSSSNINYPAFFPIMEFNSRFNSMKQVTMFEEGRMRKGVGIVVLVSTIS